MTPNEHNIFGQLCLGIVDPDVRARIHRVMGHGEKRHGGRPLQSAEIQMEHSKDHWTLRGFHDLSSGLPHEDHAMARTMLAIVKMMQEIGNE
jgi:hypothetical protein